MGKSPGKALAKQEGRNTSLIYCEINKALCNGDWTRLRVSEHVDYSVSMEGADSISQRLSYGSSVVLL